MLLSKVCVSEKLIRAIDRMSDMKSSLETYIPWWSTDFVNGEDKAVAEAVRNRQLSQGELTRQFEMLLEAYLGVRHVVAVTNGSSALLISLLAIGIRPGDEVIVPNRTWIATAHAVHLLGAVPVFVDTESERPIMNVADIEHRISSKTRAIIPVHMNGRSVRMKELQQMASAYDLAIIEDAAQALGSLNSNGNRLGTESLIGCFSLSVAKIISTGQGGFAVTNDDAVADRLRAIRTHGIENSLSGENWHMPGFNFRFTDLLASIGIVQMQLLPTRINRLAEIQKSYTVAIQNIRGIQMIPTYEHEVSPYVEVLVERRTSLINYLKDELIETRPFYPDLDTAPYWKNQGEFINSKKFSKHGLYLPSGPAISDRQIQIVVTALERYRLS